MFRILLLILFLSSLQCHKFGSKSSESSSSEEEDERRNQNKVGSGERDQNQNNGTIRSEGGLLSGVAGSVYSNVTVFKGIPYAAAPNGSLRWRDPQPAPKWDGIRNADTFGPKCAQLTMGTATSTMDGSEDCLYLNIWTGAAGQKQKKLRPVYVWIHGGGYTGGYGSDTTFDGEALANKGLVVVTINYRLGVMGFLATPALSQESGRNSSGNYGLLDQIAALKWVQRNIKAFGGDPKKVTIGGQSAGAGSCLILALSPLAKGLFRGAIPESGGVFFTRDPEISGLPSSHRNLSEAEQAGLAYLASKNVSANATLAELRDISAELLLSAMGGDQTSPFVTWNGQPPVFRPVLDGYVIARTYQETMEAGLQNNVAIMTGNNHDEWGAALVQNTTVEAYNTTASEKYGNMTDEFLQLYPANNDTEAGTSMNEAIRDNSRTSTYLWSQQWLKHAKKPLFTYFWTHAAPSSAQTMGSTSGASHGSEIQYFFGNLYAMNATWTSEDRQIAETMSNYVANFVKNGNPNGPNVPKWPKSDGKNGTVMEVGQNYAQMAVANPLEAKIDFLKRFYGTQPVW